MKSQNKKIKKTVIITGYQCNNNCRFCLNVNKRNLNNKNTEQVKQEMLLARKQNSDYLELIGGEPSIRSDIIDLIQFAHKLKFNNVVMATNGRLFSYKKFAAKIIKAGLTDLIFSIHGHNAELHDFLTQSKGSFKQMLKGIKNVRSLGLKRIGTNTIIVKFNYKELEKIGKLILKLGFKNSEFIFVDPTYGAAYDNFIKFVPKISLAAPYIKKCLDLARNKNFHWVIRYVPLCYFADYLDQISELQETITFHTKHFAPDFFNLDVEDSRKKIARTKTKKCANCRLYKQCEGIWKEYIKHYGDKEIKPI